VQAYPKEGRPDGCEDPVGGCVERAQSGLIVTTSALTPSAETIRTAREYPIAIAEKGMLKDWIEQLRSPGSGTFMA